MRSRTEEPEVRTEMDTGRGIVGLALLLLWPLATAAVPLAVAVVGLPLIVGTIGALLLPVGMLLVRLVPPSGAARGWMVAGIALAAGQIILGLATNPTDVTAPPPDAAEELPEDIAPPPEAVEEAPEDIAPPPEAVELPLGVRLLAAAQALLLGGAVATFAWAMRRWLRPTGEQQSATWWTIYTILAVVAAVMFAALSVFAFPATMGAPADLATAGMLVIINAVLLLAAFVVHIGACITGIVALKRLG